MKESRGSDASIDEFALVRIDDRLLHGQVRLNWMRTLFPRIVVIVDDIIAHDLGLRAALDVLVPEDVGLVVASPEGLAERMRNDPSLDAARTMLLLRDPASAWRLYERGVRYVTLNLGCLGVTSERQRVSKQVALSLSEWRILSRLAAEGVRVSLQALPTDPAVPLDRLAPRFEARS